jgi:cellobiose epimerase
MAAYRLGARLMRFLSPFLIFCGALGIALSAIAPESWAAPQETKTAQEKTPEPVDNAAPKQHELGPQQFKRKIDQLLRDELTQHWYPHAVDRERGGFHQTMARDWSLRPDENIFLVYQARMTWTAAAFAQYSRAHHDEFVGYARHGIEFLDQKMRDREFGGFHWVLDTAGRVDPNLGNEKHTYGLAFVIYAASKVQQVTGDELALKVAVDAFDWMEENAHDAKNGGYFETLRRDGTPIPRRERNAPVPKRPPAIGVPPGLKSTNAHLHVLEALAALSKVDKREIVKERLREVFLIFRDRLIAEPGALYTLLTQDWRPVSTEDSFGHDIEAAYLMVESAHALGMPDDPKTWQVARLLVDHALKWGWDSEYGGFCEKARAPEAKPFDQKKIWWAEAEALNTLLLMHWKYGDRTDRYWIAFLKVWDFAEKYLIDPEHGGWYMQTTRAGKIMGDDGKAHYWKANYHTSRTMINVAKLLGMMAEPQGAKR